MEKDMEPKGVEVKPLAMGMRERLKKATNIDDARFHLLNAIALHKHGGLSDKALRRCRKAFEEKWGGKE
jgi:hypothetical protein